jgi:Domain of unknown function (DUF4326)
MLSELERRAIVEAGGTVLANVHQDHDPMLIGWAKEHGRYVYIGKYMRWTGHKRSIWHNPFSRRKHGRDEVVRLYREYILKCPGLLAQLPNLRGNVLGCWCYPEPCHGDVLIELLI